MKKVILGILSLLLISPAFASNYNLGQYNNIFLSFESLNSSDNILYGFGFRGSQGYIATNSNFNDQYKGLFYFSDDGSLKRNISSFESESTQYGTTYSDSNGFNAFSISGSDLYVLNSGSTFLGYGLFSIGKNGDIYNPGVLNFYYQRVANSSSSAGYNFGKNYTLNFGNYNSSGNGELISNNSFLRFLYNSDSFFTSGYFPSINNSVPSDFQYFIKNNVLFKTLKGQASIGVPIDKVSPNLLNGFSFIPSFNLSSPVYFDDLKFYTVFPNWDYTWSDSNLFSISSFTDKFYMFRLNSNYYHSDINNIGVISKCSIDLCSGLSLEDYLSSLVYSEYICNISSNFIDIKNECVLVYGGLLYKVLGNITGYNSVITGFSTDFMNILFNSVSFKSSSVYSSIPVFFSSDVTNNTLSISNFNLVDRNSTTGIPGIKNSTFNLIFTGGFSSSNPPDILHTINFSQGSVGGYNPNPDEISDLQNLYCQQNPTSPYCNGIYTGSWDTVRCGLTSSGLVNCYFTDFGWPTISEECPTIESGLNNGQVFIQYWNTGENRCVQGVSAYIESSSPLGNYSDLYSGTELTGIENEINLAFSGVIGGNFKFYSCPFNSPFRAFRLGSIGGLSDFLLDKFFDINITGPFSCLLGGILYSETDSKSLGSQLLLNSYNGEKYLNNFPDNVKSTINWLLFAGMILFFWAFRPKEH